jgi:hypothetical protein
MDDERISEISFAIEVPSVEAPLALVQAARDEIDSLLYAEIFGSLPDHRSVPTSYPPKRPQQRHWLEIAREQP